jgi:hypothetical protein
MEVLHWLGCAVPGENLSLCVLDLIAPQQRQSAPLGDSLLGWAGELMPARCRSNACQFLTLLSAFTHASPQGPVKEGGRRRARQGWGLAAILAVSVPQVTDGQLPKPLTDALTLLGWSGGDVPRIVVVDQRPPDATVSVDAWVRFDTEGRAMPVIYVRTDTDLYRDAVRQDYQALVRLAGILAHERWHLRHGRDEEGAYTAQLSTMEYLHANSTHLAQVRRALRRVTHQTKGIGPPPVGAQDEPKVSRVRADTPSIVEAIRAGLEHSATYRNVVATIDRSDGLIYIEPGKCGAGVLACLALSVKIAGPYRILRILVDPRKKNCHLTASIGHELQHAAEALSDPKVNSNRAIYFFFHQRDMSTPSGGFETREAIRVGLDVMAELQKHTQCR